MHCENCALLEKRIEQLRIENLEIENRRSRERSRFAALEETRFKRILSGCSNEDQPCREMVSDLLDILKRVVDDPNEASLLIAKEQLEKYLI
jgi:hypothetical protein